MFLGRSTIQWTGLISAAVSALQILLPLWFPSIDPVTLATTLGTIGILLGVLIAFIANTQTTPISSPVLAPGTPVTIATAAGEPNLTITLPGAAGDAVTATANAT